MREITAPSASLAIGSEPFISLNSEYDESGPLDECPQMEIIEASPSVFDDDVTALVSKLPDIKIWGLLDT